jgi:carnitine-CoA ligase
VTSEFGEQEVMLAVQPRPGRQFDPRELIEFLIPRLPHFMIPRYVRVMDQLPYTPSNKVEKSVMCKEGITADTWDREAAGLVLRRTRLS